MRRLLTVAVLGLLAICACNAILGLDERPAASDDLDGSRAQDEGGSTGEGGGEGGPTAVCEAGRQACGSTCVETQSDTHHCGQCLHDCQGADCSGGFCAATVALVRNIVADLFFDATTESLVFRNGDAVVEVCKASSCATTAHIVISNVWSSTIVAGNTFLYWTDYDGGALKRSSTTSSMTTTVASLAAIDGGVPQGLAIGTGAEIYFTYGQQVVKCTDICPTPLPSLGTLTQPAGLSATPSGLVFVDDRAGGVHICNLGCAPWAAEAMPTHVATNASDVYWYAGGHIRSCGLSKGCTGTGAADIVDIPANPLALAVDETGVYWVDITDGIFWHHGAITTKLWAGAGVTTLALGSVLGARRLFFVSGGAISSIPR